MVRVFRSQEERRRALPKDEEKRIVIEIPIVVIWPDSLL